MLCQLGVQAWSGVTLTSDWPRNTSVHSYSQHSTASLHMYQVDVDIEILTLSWLLLLRAAQRND